MAIPSRIKTLFRGELRLADMPREALRRRRVAAHRREERQLIAEIDAASARLSSEFAEMSPDELLAHFAGEERCRVRSDAGLAAGVAGERVVGHNIDAVLTAADRIARGSTWELAGFGTVTFHGENVWRRDPLTGKDWGLDYHADVVTYLNDGPDIRILWELNRFGHALTLARAYEASGDEALAETFFAQIESWLHQNPYGRGANWNCAMEVALRLVALLAAFDIFRHAEACTAERLGKILALFDRHGRFIFDNNEFTFVSTSNHYLSDVAGLFWIGTMLPELADAAKWREFGLREMLSEMDVQVLPDGADFESSTGYHRFVAELFLTSFLLAEKHGVEIPAEYRTKLKGMFRYLAALTRPDGRMPLIGDADGSQFLPIVNREGDEAAHLLALATIYFDEPEFKVTNEMPPEALWLFGEKAERFEQMPLRAFAGSAVFADAGAVVLRNEDLYLHLNASDCGVNGRGSHAHNDVLSVEVWAQGHEFIIDPGSYVYNLDRKERHRFRSTAFHSTVMVDSVEQNTIDAEMLFVIGNEAEPAIVAFEAGEAMDVASAEHFGYRRLSEPVVHRRAVEFNKNDGYWTIADTFAGTGRHELRFSFHIAPGMVIEIGGDGVVSIAAASGVRVFMFTDLSAVPGVSQAWRSRNYGNREETQMLSWTVHAAMPFAANFMIVPSSLEDATERAELIRRLSEAYRA